MLKGHTGDPWYRNDIKLKFFYSLFFFYWINYFSFSLPRTCSCLPVFLITSCLLTPTVTERILFALFCCVFRFVLFCFVLFCFVLFCFVFFCFVLFCFVLFCFVLFCLGGYYFCFFYVINYFLCVSVSVSVSVSVYLILPVYTPACLHYHLLDSYLLWQRSLCLCFLFFLFWFWFSRFCLFRKFLDLGTIHN